MNDDKTKQALIEAALESAIGGPSDGDTGRGNPLGNIKAAMKRAMLERMPFDQKVMHIYEAVDANDSFEDAMKLLSAAMTLLQTDLLASRITGTKLGQPMCTYEEAVVESEQMIMHIATAACSATRDVAGTRKVVEDKIKEITACNQFKQAENDYNDSVARKQVDAVRQSELAKDTDEKVAV